MVKYRRDNSSVENSMVSVVLYMQMAVTSLACLKMDRDMGMEHIQKPVFKKMDGGTIIHL